MNVVQPHSANVLVRFILSKIDLVHHAIFSTGKDVRAGDCIDGELKEEKPRVAHGFERNLLYEQRLDVEQFSSCTATNHPDAVRPVELARLWHS